MLLALDIGNTNIKFGVFRGDETVSFWRMTTVASRTSDEYGVLLIDLLTKIGVKPADIDAVIMSSVAPALNYTIEHLCKDFLGKIPYMVSSRTDVGIKLLYTNPSELGTDRIVDSAAAYHLYGGPVIVADFGSATTFNLVNAQGEYLGGAIAPGIKIATESLVNTAAKLPRIELAKPVDIVGKDTVSCMQSGIIYGFTGLVKYMIEKYRAIDGMQNAKVVATGGLSALIQNVEPSLIDVVDRPLALKGLNYIYGRISAK